ncbi:MAG: hypothetical protein IT458_14410 [Planctomycetes bacterium]|nr:hypothetical protein [Planctomycetota bacterium]
MSPLNLLPILGGLILLPFLPLQPEQDKAAAAQAPNRFIGAQACKNCHNGPEKGDTFDKWQKGPHAKAFETLGTPKAKEIAAKLKIEDPQKSEQCLKCHQTAFGVDAKEIKRGFKHEAGVQCESCHGAGEEHFKIRFKESQAGGTPTPVGANEIAVKRDVATCQKCHNDKSPTYKDFCLKERMKEIEHYDPRKKRSEEDLKKLRDACTPDCPKCSGKDKKADK